MGSLSTLLPRHCLVISQSHLVSFKLWSSTYIAVSVSDSLLKYLFRMFSLLTSALCFSGVIVGGAFFHMRYKEKNKKKSQQKDAKDQTECDKLNA